MVSYKVYIGYMGGGYSIFCKIFYRVFQMVFFYKVYIGYIGGTLCSANSSIGNYNGIV